MIRILCLAALCLTAAAAFPKNNRIIYGSPATIEQYPFMAGLLEYISSYGVYHICGGTIINNRSVLTASHCIFSLPTARITIRVGSPLTNSGGYVHNAATLITHPEYTQRTLENDIGIVRVTTAFSFGANVQAASIAGPNYFPAENDAVWAAGWGQTATAELSEELLHVQLNVVSQTVCGTIYETNVNDKTICAGGVGHGVCGADSGGPLVHNNVLVGVVTAGYQKCGVLPDVFVRVSSYTNWIQQNA